MTTATSVDCNKCLKGTMRIDPLDGDLTCINCGYVLTVAVSLVAGIPTLPQRKQERTNIQLSYYLTPYYQK